MKIAIIKYNAGNILSVKNALDRLNVESIITDDPAELNSADKVIFPGVGEASSAMQHLHKNGLHTVIRNLKQPVLGICLGMQLLCASSEEGNTDALGIINVRVRKFVGDLKIPHVGWNSTNMGIDPLFDKIRRDEYFYFVHSYYAPLCSATIAACSYISEFSAALKYSNFYGVQFHPEKSGNAGQQILKNFIYNT
jgi:imidazole glycerol-phosphate synthase subunit HisH